MSRGTGPDRPSEVPVTHRGTRPVEIRAITVFGLSVRTVTWPATDDNDARPPLLIFNGIGAGYELLIPFADELSDRTIITFDVPGAGESDPPAMPYRLWMLTILVGRLLDELGVDEVDALGVSWGGAAVQQFALQNPHRCRRLILAATTPGVVMVPPPWSVLRGFMTPRRFNDPAYLHRIAGQIYGGKAVDGAPLESFGQTSRRGYLLQQFALAGWTSVGWLRLVRQPALVLAGDDDRIVRVANLRILDRLLPDSRMHTLEDGHLFIISSAAETAELVTEFLDSPVTESRPS